MLPEKSWLQASSSFLIWAVVFGLVYCQAPLYYSNQNQYFLHGLADAGHGFLAEDWLANTADPTPLFSLLVAWTYRFLHPYFFHLYYVILFGIYFASLVGIFEHLVGERNNPRLRIGFMALILAFHSALARWASQRLFGQDYPWFFQAGVAGQYVLGAMFQPSTFGVLLILAIYLFIRDRPFWAVFSACLGATVHSTYLLGAAFLTLAFMFVLWREGKTRQALLVGGWALALALPVTIFVLITFRPTSADSFAQAQEILVHLRIPHHCLPELWCDGIALAQIGWILLALFLVRKTRLFPILLVALAWAAALTVLQVISKNDALALLFPWRISAILVPIASAVLLGRLVLWTRRWFESLTGMVVSIAVVCLLAVSGVLITVFRQGFQSSDLELEMMDFVKTSTVKGDLYLIPVQIPNLKATTRGSLSSDFKPLAAKLKDLRVIPVDLQRFRLYTGAPIFVDFKAIPYQDTDVREWKYRLDLNQKFFDHLQAKTFSEVGEEIRLLGITHVVATVDRDLDQPGLEKIHQDRAYRVYRIKR